MTGLVTPFDFTMFLSYPSRRLLTGPSRSTTNNLTDPNRDTPAHRSPLLSFAQAQPNNFSTSFSSKSSAWSTSACLPRSSKPVAFARRKRRKLRSNRGGSPSSAPHATSRASDVPYSRPGNKKSIHHEEHERHDSQPKSDSDDDDMPPPPHQRLKLTPTFIPKPPVILAHIVVPLSQCSYLHTPLVQPSCKTTRESGRETRTCINTKINPYSVSISSQPSAHFSKTVPRLARLQKSSPLSVITPGSMQNLLEVKRSEEQDKWWYWAKNCRITGDDNKSSHLIPLRCRNLKRHCQSDDEGKYDGTGYTSNHCIRTRTLIESALDQQKYYYSG